MTLSITAESTLVDQIKQTEKLDEQANSDWEMLSALLMELVSRRLPPDFRGLSDEAVSREGIYADHP